MFKKASILTVVVLVCSACEVQADIINSEWVGGGEGEWGQASNWEPAIVPDNSSWRTFAVTINSNSIGVDEVEVTLRQNRTIDRLDTYGEVELARRIRAHLDDIVLAIEEDLDLTLAVLEPDNGLTNHGFLDVEDVTVYGDVLNTDDAYFDGAGLDIFGGDFYNEGRVGCEEGYLDVHDGNIFNHGSVVCGGSKKGGLWAAGGLQNCGLIELLDGTCSSDQAFTNESSGKIRGFGMLLSKQVVRSSGLVQSLGGGLVIHGRVDLGENPTDNAGITNTGILANCPGTSLTVMISAPDVSNQGTIEVNSDGSILFDCILANDPNATIKLLGGTLAAKTITQSAGATFEGFGGITGDVLVNPDGIIRLTGPTNIVGDVTIEDGATLEISDGTTLLTGQATCNGTIHMKGGRIIPQGGFSGDCSIIWEPGTYANIADFNLDGTVDFKDFTVFADTWLWQQTGSD
ncbi:MAG: hypothetical protein PVJ86_09925 [Phycisphaerales bacterium]|jgi:hypothetical protein